jgi:dihydrodipicolinate synthase/N-acetylneuraminate lyase
LRAAGDTPLYAYTFPARTGNDLSPEAFGALVADGLAGLKDSTSDDALHEAYLAAAPDAEVFVGSPSHLLHALRAGSRGGVAALANLRPELVLALAAAWHDGEAERLQEEVRAAERALAREPALVALKRGVSELMAERGARYPAALRSPLGA